MALGNPFGLGGSESRGILSSKTRRSTSQDGILDMEDWIQTDAAINPGNSGGPLVNLDGNLIGLNVAIFKEGQGIGFAIPVKRVTEALGEIFTPEVLRKLWFGVEFKQTTNGVSVAAVEQDSPAEKGGLQGGDIIVEFAGQKIANIYDYTYSLDAVKIGQPVKIVVERTGKRIDVTVTPEARK